MVMDPLSISTAIPAVLGSVPTVVTIVSSVREALDKRKKLLDKLEVFRYALEGLNEHVRRCSPGDPWLDGLLYLREPVVDHKDPRSVVEYTRKGLIPQLERVIGEMNLMLNPTNRIKQYHIVQRTTYHWDKDKFDETIKELNECCTMITLFISGGSKKDAERYFERSLTQGQRHELQLITLSTEFSKFIIELRDETENEGTRAWLSPFDFLAKQDALIEGNFDTGEWLLNSFQFRSWLEGRPWYLRCLGEPGSGKVCRQSSLRGSRLTFPADSSFSDCGRPPPKTLPISVCPCSLFIPEL